MAELPEENYHELSNEPIESSAKAETSAVSPPEAVVQEEREIDGHPPKDGGRGAWMFLFGASIVEMIAWGFNFSYGVFRAYYFQNPVSPFQGVTIISIVGVVGNGTLQIIMPAIMYYLNNFPNHRKNAMWLGSIISCLAPIGGAYSTSPISLILTLGFLYGIGGSLLFAPTIHLMHDWFAKRKSLAYGVICGAGALAGAVLPPIYASCLERYHHKATLIGWSICSLILTTIGLLCIHPRVPPRTAPRPSLSDFESFRKPLFHVLLFSTVIQSLAHFVSSIYLPSYGEDYGLSATQASLLSTFLNLSQAVGQPLQGHLADWTQSFYPALLISTLGGTITVTCIWGFARNLWSLILFSLAYGVSAGGYAVLRPLFSAAVVGNDNNNEQSMLIFSVLTALRGAGIVGSGFASTELFHEKFEMERTWAGGKRYRSVLIYVAVMMFGASFGIVGRWVPAGFLFGRKNKGSGEDEGVPVDAA